MAVHALHYHLNHHTGNIAAIAAAIWKATISSPDFGCRGTHLIAKNAIIGICPSISNCHKCAAVPSSDWRVTPKVAAYPSTIAKAAADITTGRNALGRFSNVAFTEDFPDRTRAQNNTKSERRLNCDVNKSAASAVSFGVSAQIWDVQRKGNCVSPADFMGSEEKGPPALRPTACSTRSTLQKSCLL